MNNCRSIRDFVQAEMVRRGTNFAALSDAEFKRFFWHQVEQLLGYHLDAPQRARLAKLIAAAAASDWPPASCDIRRPEPPLETLIKIVWHSLDDDQRAEFLHIMGSASPFIQSA
jgi:hypothetical protein